MAESPLTKVTLVGGGLKEGRHTFELETLVLCALPVEALKEHITTLLSIPTTDMHLTLRGRVLPDTTVLTEEEAAETLTLGLLAPLDATNTGYATPLSPEAAEVAAALATLIELGFAEAEARPALEAVGPNPHAAMEWILAGRGEGGPATVEREAGAPTEERPLAAVVQPALAQGMCTFTATGPEFVYQEWWECVSCGYVNGRGVCASCAIRCHGGCELRGPRRSTFYCDCAAGPSCLAQQPM